MFHCNRLLLGLFGSLLPILFAGTTEAQTKVTAGESLWSPIEVEVVGPEAAEDGEINPFLDYRMTATFTHLETLEQIDVPGYFAADGDAADSGASAGSIWRAYFIPHKPGAWGVVVSLRTGDRIALSNDPDAGEPVDGDTNGQRLVVTVGLAPDAPGILEAVGERYLQFSGSGERWLKSGADSPENFLAYNDFDNTVAGRRRGGVQREGEADFANLHSYEPHLRDWEEGDPTWGSEKGKGMIGAINYLASQGVNSIYFITMNIRGDGRDVWPYTDLDERFRFDVSKLEQWGIVFDHMESKGLLLHVLLTETENENLFEYEQGETEFADARKLYYRELIARFGHHRMLVWNLGEENGGNDGPQDNPNPYGLANTDAQRKAFADYIQELDPYDHPIVVHTFPNQYDKIYTPLLGHPTIAGPSLQMGDMTKTHAETIKWIDASSDAGHPWFVCLDEIGPASTGVKPDAVDPEHDEPRRHALWGNLMAGGSGVEWYFGYQFPHNDLNLEDFRSREQIWKQTRIAIEFFQEQIPFGAMNHADEIVQSPEGSYGFADPGRLYVAYVPRAEEVVLGLPTGTYTVQWFNPRTGGELQVSGESDSADKLPTVTVGEEGVTPSLLPPNDPERDWVLLVTRIAE